MTRAKGWNITMGGSRPLDLGFGIGKWLDSPRGCTRLHQGLQSSRRCRKPTVARITKFYGALLGFRGGGCASRFPGTLDILFKKASTLDILFKKASTLDILFKKASIGFVPTAN